MQKATTPETAAPTDPLPQESQSADTEIAPRGRVYSARLKVMIVVTGAVLGLCAYAVIALPTLIKKKRS